MINWDQKRPWNDWCSFSLIGLNIPRKHIINNTELQLQYDPRQGLEEPQASDGQSYGGDSILKTVLHQQLLQIPAPLGHWLMWIQWTPNRSCSFPEYLLIDRMGIVETQRHRCAKAQTIYWACTVYQMLFYLLDIHILIPWNLWLFPLEK